MKICVDDSYIKPLERSRELKTPIRLGSQSDTSHLPIPNFQGCIVSSSQGKRTRISFRTAPSRISIASSGNALARGVAKRAPADPFHVSRIHEASPLRPRVMTARSLCLCRENAVSTAWFTRRLFPVPGPIRTSSGCTSVPRATR